MVEERRKVNIGSFAVNNDRRRDLALFQPYGESLTRL